MAGNLGVHAYVVKRACCDGGDDIARFGAGGSGRAEVAALTGRYRSDDEPDQDDKPADSHIYLRKTGSSYAAEEPRHIFVYPRHGRYTWSRGWMCRKFGTSRHKEYPCYSFSGSVYRVC
jgi:hypothetical protein